MDTVVVFDFDLTIVDCDSDPWVMEQLGATDLFDSLLPTLPWNPLMVNFFYFYFLSDDLSEFNSMVLS
jgi:hypothetical protein